MIIDAEDAVLGRLSSFVAKNALKGEKVDVINAEKAIITGDPKFSETKYVERIARGSPQHGPFYPTKPELILRRAIRGMINYKKPSGKKAYGNIRVYVGIPASLKGKEAVSFSQKQKPVECRYTRLEDISRKLR